MKTLISFLEYLWMFKNTFFDRFVGIRKKPEDATFQHMLNFAQQVAAQNPLALVDVMRLFLRPLQTELLISAASRELHGACQPIEALKFFAPEFFPALGTLSHYPRLPVDGFIVDLARDPVLPCPWRRNRYVDAIAYIGDGKDCGSWRQDSNHYILLWLPWGIPFVAGGNHSIAAGVLAGQGSVVPTEVWDLSSWLALIETDGKFYFDKKTGKSICAVTDPVRAAIFETGRLMVEHSVVPMVSNVNSPLDLAA